MRNMNPFLRKIPLYLDPISSYSGLTPEKKTYIEFIKSLMRQIKIVKNDRIAIFGVGRGLESQVVAEILDDRQRNNEPHLKDFKLHSIDISSAILRSLKKSTFSDRVKSGLVRANVLSLSKKTFPDNAYNLIAMSSLLHEIQSEKDWQAAVSVFLEAERILAPNGYIIIRDFYIPTTARQILEFKTPLAKKFFSHFCLSFQNHNKMDWQKEWVSINKNEIECSSAFAFELLQHFRMFYKNYYKNLGEGILNYFFQWAELKESYGLMPNHSSSAVADIIKSLTETAKANYAGAYFFTPDDNEDQIIMDNFSCLELNSAIGHCIKSHLFPGRKLIVVFQKLSSQNYKNNDSGVALKELLSSLTNSAINIFDIRRHQEL
jgi:ubiquinone/menaquinone biosynthesis C-methylase UbiE